MSNTRRGKHALTEDVAIILATANYTGSTWRDHDVWAESVDEAERTRFMEDAAYVVSVIEEYVGPIDQLSPPR